jgi:hypothetical protein
MKTLLKFKLAESIFGDWKDSGFDPHTKYPIPPFKALKAFRTYVGNTSWVYHGDVSKVDPTLFTSGATPPHLP